MSNGQNYLFHPLEPESESGVFRAQPTSRHVQGVPLRFHWGNSCSSLRFQGIGSPYVAHPKIRVQELRSFGQLCCQELTVGSLFHVFEARVKKTTPLQELGVQMQTQTDSNHQLRVTTTSDVPLGCSPGNGMDAGLGAEDWEPQTIVICWGRRGGLNMISTESERPVFL